MASLISTHEIYRTYSAFLPVDSMSSSDFYRSNHFDSRHGCNFWQAKQPRLVSVASSAKVLSSLYKAFCHKPTVVVTKGSLLYVIKIPKKLAVFDHS